MPAADYSWPFLSFSRAVFDTPFADIEALYAITTLITFRHFRYCCQPLLDFRQPLFSASDIYYQPEITPLAAVFIIASHCH